jgi:hypothetical protein
MKHLALAIAALAAAPAFAQPPSGSLDWSKPVEGVDDTQPLAPSVKTSVVVLDARPASAVEQQSAREFARSLNAAKLIPPPCEPPVPHAPAAAAPPAECAPVAAN